MRLFMNELPDYFKYWGKAEKDLKYEIFGWK